MLPPPRQLAIGEVAMEHDRVVSCSVCAQRLGELFARPEHHCHSCGASICEPCSPHRIQLGETSAKDRVCNRCVRVVSLVPRLLAQQNVINRRLHAACGAEVVKAATLSEALILCEQATEVLMGQLSPSVASVGQSPKAVRLDGIAELYDMDVDVDASCDNAWYISPADSHKSDILQPLSVLVSRSGEQRRVRWRWIDGVGSVKFSCWMTKYQALCEFLVMQHAHGFKQSKRCHLEFADPKEGIVLNSVEDAIAIVDVHEAGSIQWMWGDVKMPGARFNPLRWSAKNDPASTAGHLKSYLGTKDAMRKVRVFACESKCLTLGDAIVLLNGAA